MKLLEALEILEQPVDKAMSARSISLVCGFTPAHFKTFLAAHLRTHFPASDFRITTGLYGDLLGNLGRVDPAAGSEVCLVVEWTDLDPRLGIRSLGTWRPADLPDIVESARRQSARLLSIIGQLAERVPIYVSTPTLPLPPIFTTTGSQTQHEECELRAITASLAVSLSACGRTRVIAAQRLDEISPLGQRFNPNTEISSGFPYSLDHASRLAELFAAVIRDVPPKKGLITDLDDTLWAGLVGEVGVKGVTWEMSRSGHLHGLFQRFLDSLASSGVLLAIASKNDSVLAEGALARGDMLVNRDRFFPVEIHWEPKSVSVGRILQQWNIAPDDVVFIDDSPMEVAEVQTSFPDMDCIMFPKLEPVALCNLLKRLRDSFGKSAVSAEDEFRLHSIRKTVTARRMQLPGGSTEEFLRNANATLSFSLIRDAEDHRAFELINKTNQFNLNGRRLSESEWLRYLRSPEAFLLTASYEDKYGPLGKIAIALGRHVGSNLHLDFWVMSCRAFSRRIEHHCLAYLFEKTKAAEIVFDYVATLRNGPVQSFLTELLEQAPTPKCSLTKAASDAKLPALTHRVIEVVQA